MSQREKIAILTIKNSYEFGGVFTCLQKVYKFCEQYFEPTVFCLSFDKDISTSIKSLKFSSIVKEENYCGMNYVNIGARWAFWEPGHYTFTLSSWQKLLSEYKYFFVVSGNCMAAYPLVLLNKNFSMWIASPYQDDRTQRVDGLKGFRKILYRLAHKRVIDIEKNILNRANFIWALSKYTFDRFDNILQQSKDNMVVCNYPIDIKKDIKNKDFLERKLINKNIIAVGRFSDPRKNIAMLLRAFERIYKVMPEAKLYIVGSRPEDNFLAKLPSISGFENITFTGNVSDQELDKLYANSSLMLLTSYQEGLGIVGLEAFSYGIPVVSTDCGGPKDFIINGQNGYLININDDLEMANKAIEILSDKELLTKMSKFSKKFVEDNFSDKKIFSLFAYGLSQVYPELKDKFIKKEPDIFLNIIENKNMQQNL